jgi:hypothetical protein
MDARQLKDAMARYLATVNADDPDEWYATDREIYSEVLERFAQWLETADQPAACPDDPFRVLRGFGEAADQQSSRRGFDFKCGCGADNWNRYECGVCGKDPHKPADQQAVSMQDSMQACTRNDAALVQPARAITLTCSACYLQTNLVSGHADWASPAIAFGWEFDTERHWRCPDCASDKS